MSYEKTHWENTPSEESPINAQNLNHLEDGVENNDQRITVLEGRPLAHKILDKIGSLLTQRGKLQFTGIATVTDNAPNDKTIVNIPSSLSAYTNDAGFITNTVNNLTNYYLKSETYTQAEVNALISAIVTLNILVVQTLPTQDISTTTIYLVPKATAETQDVYDEYIYVNNAWEHIGSTQVDLSNYYTKTEADNLLGNKVDKVTGKQLSTEDFTSALKSKLEGIASGAEVNVQANWNETDNTSDAYIQNKPTIPSATSDLTNDSNFVSDANYTHTDNNYTTTEKNKLSGIEAGAQANVQADWNQTDNTADDYIKNKPTIPDAQIQSDWSQTDTSAKDYIKNKPTIPSDADDIDYDNTTSGLTATNVQDAIDEVANGSGSGGHTIWNRIKTALTQRTNLWFKDANVTDDSTDSATAIEIITSTTGSAFDALPTDGSADGCFEINDEDMIPIDAYGIGYGQGSVGSALDTLNSELFLSYKGYMGFEPVPSLNFNDYKTSGWYRNGGTNQSGTQNAPHSADNGYMLVISSGSDSRTVYQFWFSIYRGTGVVMRKCYQDTWDSWRTVIS